MDRNPTPHVVKRCGKKCADDAMSFVTKSRHRVADGKSRAATTEAASADRSGSLR
jgi:hypothetical protein